MSDDGKTAKSQHPEGQTRDDLADAPNFQQTLKPDQGVNMTEWQPIETAPKGAAHLDTTFGPMILMASTSGHRAVGYWGRGLDKREGWINPHDHMVMNYWNAFTHWMPIPEPPK